MKIDVKKHVVSVPAEHYNIMMRDLANNDLLDDLIKGLLGYIGRYVRFTSSVAPRIEKYLKDNYGIVAEWGMVHEMPGAPIELDSDKFTVYLSDVYREDLDGVKHRVPGVSEASKEQK